MKKGFYSFLITALIISTSLTSCVMNVILDAGEKSMVAVECILKNCETQELHLNFTKGASKDDFEPITNAVAVLIDLTEANEVKYQFERCEGNIWKLDYTPVPFHKYRLEVSIPGYETIYAEDVMPNKIDVLERSVTTIGPDFRHIPNIGVTYLWEDGDINDIVRERYSDKTGRYVFLKGSFYYIRNADNSFLVYGMNYNPENDTHEIAEEICTDHPDVHSYNLTGKIYSPSYLEGFPKIQLYPILEGFPIHRRFLIFPKEAVTLDPYFLISGNFTGDWCFTSSTYPRKYPPSSTDSYLLFVSISDIYESYLNDAIPIQSIKESADLSNIYIRENIYSNINGGIGIFAAINEQRVEWDKRYTDIGAFENYWRDYETDADSASLDGYLKSVQDLLISGVLSFDIF